MTSSEQPKEYIITDEELKSLTRFMNDSWSDKYQAQAVWAICTARSRPHPAPANPCEENGCTDTENCDEICEHMRIYSPAYVREKTRKAREETIYELLKHFKFSCPGGELTPICDMCGANPYCIELRQHSGQAGDT